MISHVQNWQAAANWQGLAEIGGSAEPSPL